MNLINSFDRNISVCNLVSIYVYICIVFTECIECTLMAPTKNISGLLNFRYVLIMIHPICNVSYIRDIRFYFHYINLYCSMKKKPNYLLVRSVQLK